MSNGARTALQGGLLLVIAGLGYGLYRSVHDPWAARERRHDVRESRESVRRRMLLNGQVLARFNEVNGHYPHALDTLAPFARADAVLSAAADSLFGGLALDSLPYSPRTGKRFLYTVSDTTRPAFYRLADPDNPEDFISPGRGEATHINAVSWE